MLNCVSNLISEPRPAINHKEKNLYIAWLNQAYNSSNLQTIGGKSLSILSPGQRNEVEGPDFKDALILVDGTFERGAVELHLESADWYSHGHDHDPLYNDVILHVVLNARKTDYVTTQNGRKVPNLAILPIGETAAEEYACTHWKSIGIPEFHENLKTFAGIRFQRKGQTFRSAIFLNGLEQTFYEGLADVLGYSRNRLTFSRLVQKLPISMVNAVLSETAADDRIIVLEGLLFGMAGFLTEPHLKEYIRDSKYATGLRRIWLKTSRKYLLKELEQAEWHFAGSRPPNFPTLRLAAFAQIIAKFLPGQSAEPAEPAKNWVSVISNTQNYQIVREWAGEMFQQPDGLWLNHPLLKYQPGKVLIGTQRFEDLLSNLLLPFAWAVGTINQNRDLIVKALKFAEQVGSQSGPGFLRATLNRLSVPGGSLRSNFLQQGLIEFTRRYCNLNLCKLCPLEKYAEK
ncbi:MAG: DUF2851 family protein [Candidatus Neomarinimicrobiota bacterium]